MKVIELLNKIAKGEKVPKVIYFWEREYIYDEEYNCYMHQTGANEFINLLDNDNDDSYCFLNDEVQLSKFGDVEVLENNPIYKIGRIYSDQYLENSCYEALTKAELVLDIDTLKIKINEIIDKLNGEQDL